MEGSTPKFLAVLMVVFFARKGDGANAFTAVKLTMAVKSFICLQLYIDERVKLS